MPTINEELNKRTALAIYGPWVGKPMHDTPKPVPSFVAHVLLVNAYRMPDAEAASLVDDLIKRARRTRATAAVHFTTHKGERTWLAEAAPTSPATMISIAEQH